MTGRYLVKPKAGLDLDESADYFTQEANLDLGLRFLKAAHETFALLATQPKMGWSTRSRRPPLKSVRIFRIMGFEQFLVIYQPVSEGVDVLRSSMGPETFNHSCVGGVRLNLRNVVADFFRFSLVFMNGAKN